MPLLATKGPYALKISYDDDPLNPREDYDNFGTMCCWHSRYNLGDEHNHSEPREMMAAPVEATVPDKDLISVVRAGSDPDMRLEYNRSRHEWVLESYDDYFKQWFEDYALNKPLKGNEYLFADAIRENLSMKSLSELAERANCILPLYLYDHSCIPMSTS